MRASISRNRAIVIQSEDAEFHSRSAQNCSNDNTLNQIADARQMNGFSKSSGITVFPFPNTCLHEYLAFTSVEISIVQDSCDLQRYRPD